MNDRTCSETVQTNERVKLISSILSNLGTALIATSVARWFLTDFDAFVFIWLVGSAVLIWSGWHILTMLEAENEHG